MIKVKVLGLPRCSWCRALTGELDELSIPYSFVNVDEQPQLADKLEALLETQDYPMVLLEQNYETVYYLYRPEGSAHLGLGRASDGCNTIGCATIDAMVSNIKNILK